MEIVVAVIFAIDVYSDNVPSIVTLVIYSEKWNFFEAIVSIFECLLGF